MAATVTRAEGETVGTFIGRSETVSHKRPR